MPSPENVKPGPSFLPNRARIEAMADDGLASPHVGPLFDVLLLEVEERVREEGLVLEERGDLRDAVLPRALKPSLRVAALLEQEARPGARGLEISRLGKGGSGGGEAGNRERVPARDALVVEGRRDALCSR